MQTKHVCVSRSESFQSLVPVKLLQAWTGHISKPAVTALHGISCPPVRTHSDRLLLTLLKKHPKVVHWPGWFPILTSWRVTSKTDQHDPQTSLNQGIIIKHPNEGAHFHFVMFPPCHLTTHSPSLAPSLHLTVRVRCGWQIWHGFLCPWPSGGWTSCHIWGSSMVAGNVSMEQRPVQNTHTHTSRRTTPHLRRSLAERTHVSDCWRGWGSGRRRRASHTPRRNAGLPLKIYYIQNWERICLLFVTASTVNSSSLSSSLTKTIKILYLKQNNLTYIIVI